MSVCEFLPSIIVGAVRKGRDERGGRGRGSLERRTMQVQLHTSRQSRAACQILIFPPTRSRQRPPNGKYFVDCKDLNLFCEHPAVLQRHFRPNSMGYHSVIILISNRTA